MYRNAKLIVLLMIMLFTAVACTGSEEPAEVEPTAVPEVAVAPTDVPAVTATAVPTEPPAAPTEAPAAPTAAPTVAPTAVPVVEEAAPERFGILRFRDSDATHAGAFQLLMENVAPPPAGTHYELWLVDDRFNTLNLGPFVVESDVQFSGAAEQNLLSVYSGAFISIEPDGPSDGEIGAIAFNGTIPAGSLLHIRHVVTAFAGNPDGKAFLAGAQGELHHALEHAGFLLDELANDDIREAQRHAEHVINILDGETGASFGDLDGDTVAQNPGDGVGVRGYLAGAKQHAQLAVDAEGATAEVELHAGHVFISSDNALNRIDGAIAEALRVISSDSAAEAQPAADKLADLLDGAMNGVDANGDGAIAPIPDEGGVLTAYVHALNMGSFEFFAADGTVVTAAPLAEAPPAEEEPPAQAQPPVAAEPVSIDMANFAFAANEITVPVGTAVTWTNSDGGPRHSATAADGSFDTGLFGAGEEATITFATPGTFVYYCTLHGSPDGSGMAATITVTE